MTELDKMGDRNPMHRLGSRYIKWTAYGLWLLLVCVLQNTPRLIPPVFGARPLLVVPLVVCIAMYTGPVGGAAAGVAAGLLWDMYSTRLLGFNALLLLIIGCACGLLSACSSATIFCRRCCFRRRRSSSRGCQCWD